MKNETKLTERQNAALLDLLWNSMKPDPEHHGRVFTGWGTKTKDGLLACIERITIEESAMKDLLEALRYADDLVKIARNYFPKSIRNHDTFQLENTCATIGKAIFKAGVAK